MHNEGFLKAEHYPRHDTLKILPQLQQSTCSHIYFIYDPPWFAFCYF